MTRIHLNGVWQLTYGPQDIHSPLGPLDACGAGWETIDATVPGNVELDLIAAGRLEDPSVGSRIFALRKFETYAWCYRKSFTSPIVKLGERVELVFEGLDCIASIWLNGKQIGSADNMLIAHRFDITRHLRRGDANELFIRIESPVLAARGRSVDMSEFAFMVNYESLAVRKAPHGYGWDILPRVLSAGLWREVRLDIKPPTHLRHVYFTTLAASEANHTARALVDWDFNSDRANLDDLKIRITLSSEQGQSHQSEYPVVGTHGRTFISLTDIRLWWPRGYGRPDLYDLLLQIVDATGQELDRYEAKVGLRTSSLQRTDLTTPQGEGEFVFKINGERIFVKGTNWVPLDSLHSRDVKHLAAAFDMLVDLNCNMVRCWGGNVYEDHAFFDLCDRHGVMVWQDFAMGCAIYPQDDEFCRRVELEAASVVEKLRNHPSLVLWAGNNEIDEAYAWAGTKIDPNTDRLSRQVLPGVVRRLDPLRDYLPSSPYRAPAFFQQTRPPEEVLPEYHLWGPRNDFKGDTYSKSACHFASEIGYHGCPDRKSLEEMMDADHVWPWQDNPQWIAHAVQPHPSMHNYDYRIPLMAKQIAVLFGQVPDTLDEFVLASQISQAEAFKFFIEWFRQGKWRRTGILWWNLRDGWPVISDAIVDYYNRKKLAYAYIKRVQSDVCIICAEPADGIHNLVAVNDTREPAKGHVTIRDVDTQRVLHDGAFEIAANGISSLARLPQSDTAGVWDITWKLVNGLQGRNHYLVGQRPFVLKDYHRWMSKLGLREM